MTAGDPDLAVLDGWLAGADPVLRLPGDTDPEVVAGALRALGLEPWCADLGSARDKGTMLAGLHAALDLGEWFGFNWDALEDALHGPEDRGVPERVLILSGFSGFRGRAPEEADTLLDIVRDVALIPESGLRGCVLIG